MDWKGRKRTDLACSDVGSAAIVSVNDVGSCSSNS